MNSLMLFTCMRCADLHGPGSYSSLWQETLTYTIIQLHQLRLIFLYSPLIISDLIERNAGDGIRNYYTHLGESCTCAGALLLCILIHVYYDNVHYYATFSVVTVVRTSVITIIVHAGHGSVVYTFMYNAI